MDWLTISKDSGSGNDAVSITARTNTLLEDRTATIKFINSTYGITANTIVRQTKRSAEYIIINPTDATIDSKGAVLRLEVETNSASWRIVSLPNWATADIMSGGSGISFVFITFAENTGDTERYGTIRVLNGDNVEAVCSVTQLKPEPAFRFDPSFIEIGYEATTFTTQIICTLLTWEIFEVSDWLHVDKTSGDSSYTLTVTADENTTDENRSGFIKMRSSKGATQTLYVYQRIFVPELEITIDPTEFVFDPAGEVKYLYLTATDNWYWTGSASWVGISDEFITGGTAGTYTIALTALKNTTEMRKFGVFEITCYRGGEYKKVSFTVSQEKFTPAPIIIDPFAIPVDEDPEYITIKYNIPSENDYKLYNSAIPVYDYHPTQILDMIVDGVSVTPSSTYHLLAGEHTIKYKFDNVGRKIFKDEDWNSAGYENEKTLLTFATDVLIGSKVNYITSGDTSYQARSMWSYADNLTAVTYHNKVVGWGDIANCNSLQVVYLGAGVQIISDSFVDNAVNLAGIVCYGRPSPVLGAEPFHRGMAANGVLYYPCGEDYSEWFIEDSGNHLAYHNWSGECFEAPTPSYSLEVSTTELEVYNERFLTAEFTIKASGEWEIVESPDFSFGSYPTPSAGDEGEYNIYFRAEENTTGADRQGIIAIECGNIRKEITVKQHAWFIETTPATSPTDRMVVQPLDDDGNRSFTFHIEASPVLSWEIDAFESDNLTFSPSTGKGSSDITVTTVKKDSDDSYFTIKPYAGTLALNDINFYYHLNPVETIVVKPETIEVPLRGVNQKAFQIETYLPVSVVSKPDWVEVVNLESYNRYLNIEASTENRTGEIVFSNGVNSATLSIVQQPTIDLNNYIYSSTGTTSIVNYLPTDWGFGSDTKIRVIGKHNYRVKTTNVRVFAERNYSYPYLEVDNGLQARFVRKSGNMITQSAFADENGVFDLTIGRDYIENNITGEITTASTQSFASTNIAVQLNYMKINTFQIWSGDELVFDGHAALIEGEAGLYDNVSEELYSNATYPILYE